MGRPTELSPEERADLVRRGYRPIEVWIPDLTDDALRSQLREEARRIAAAEEIEDIRDWIEAVGPNDWDKP